MTAEQISAWFDDERFAAFRVATTTEADALALYIGHAVLASALMEVIGRSKVMLRNAAHHWLHAKRTLPARSNPGCATGACLRTSR